MNDRLVSTLMLFDALDDVEFTNASGRKVIVAKNCGATLDPADPEVQSLIKKGRLRPVPDLRPLDPCELPWSGRRPWRG